MRTFILLESNVILNERFITRIEYNIGLQQKKKSIYLIVK
jgi:hypothetical protein